jgi:hypothetical protein
VGFLYRTAKPLASLPDRAELEAIVRLWIEDFDSQLWDLQVRDDKELWYVSALSNQKPREKISLGFGLADESHWFWLEWELPEQLVVDTAILKPAPSILNTLFDVLIFSNETPKYVVPRSIEQIEELANVFHKAQEDRRATFFLCGASESSNLTRTQEILWSYVFGLGLGYVVPDQFVGEFQQLVGATNLNTGAAICVAGPRTRVIPASAIQRNPQAGGRLLQSYALTDAEYGLPLSLQQRRRRSEFSKVRDGDDLDAVIELVEERELQLSELEQENQRINEDLQSTMLELIDFEEDLKNVEREVRQLRWRVANPESHASYEPQVDLAELGIFSCMEVVEAAKQFLPNLLVTLQPGPTEVLDTHQLAEQWARTAWKMLIAVDDYVDAKKNRGFSGNLLAYANNPPAMYVPLHGDRIALNESESTDSNRQLRKIRTFSVPQIVNENSMEYMPAHLKVGKRGHYPRIHFLDDSSGSSGNVIIGYFGKHLDTGGN